MKERAGTWSKKKTISLQVRTEEPSTYGCDDVTSTRSENIL